MTGREYRTKVFEDSQALIKSDESLQKSIEKSVDGQKYIKESETVEKKERFEAPCKVHVTKNRSFEAAKEYSGKIVVHNFASATTPGGGVVKGSSAQEECLCRVSTLWNCINTQKAWDEYYNPNRAEANVIHNDDIIYTPFVRIFKNDDNKLMDKSDWFNVDVITCAAPNLREVPNNGWCNVGESNDAVTLPDNELQAIHEKRARKMLDVASAEGADVVILGAFGCGAFRNNPKVVATAYKNVIKDYRKCFKEIEFAVYCSAYDSENYEAFKEILG